MGFSRDKSHHYNHALIYYFPETRNYFPVTSELVTNWHLVVQIPGPTTRSTKSESEDG